MKQYIRTCLIVLCALSLCACSNKSVNIDKYVEKSTGAEGMILVYADSDNAVFYSGMGIFNYDLSKKCIVNVLDFEDNSIEYTQGDSAYSISVSKNGEEIILYGANGINVWRYTLNNNKFEKIDSNEIGELFSGYSEISDYNEGYFDDKPGSPEGPIITNSNITYYLTDTQSLHKDVKLVSVSESGYEEYQLFN